LKISKDVFFLLLVLQHAHCHFQTRYCIIKLKHEHNVYICVHTRVYINSASGLNSATTHPNKYVYTNTCILTRNRKCALG